MAERTSGRIGASNVRALREAVEAAERPIEVERRLAGRAGLDAAIELPGPESFRGCLGLISPGEAIAITLATGQRPVEAHVSVAARLCKPSADAGAGRPQVVERALAAALEAAYPGLVFVAQAKSDPSRPVLDHGQVLAPRATQLSAWQARALREAPQPHAVEAAGTGPAEAGRPQPLSRISLSSKALAVALRSLGQPVAIELVLQPEQLSAAELRRLAAMEQQLCEEIRRPEDPLVDVFATEELIRIRILTREATALRLKVTVRSASPLLESELDLISGAIFDAPAAREVESSGAPDLLTAFPRAIGPHALERILSASLAAALELAERPRETLAKKGTLIGRTRRGTEIRQQLCDRSQHTYFHGATGTGKSTLLQNIMIQDMAAGEGLVLIDPHGDLFHAVRAAVPQHRRADLVLADAGDPADAFTLNVLAGNSGDPGFDRNAVVNDLIELFRRVLYRGVQEAFGPMFEVYFRNAALLLMASQGPQATILEFERIFQDDEFREELIARCPLQYVADFWSKMAERVSCTDLSLHNVAPYIICKLNQITTNERLRPILGATNSSLDFADIIAKRKICLINLDKARLGEKSAAFLGGIMLSRLCMAAMGQGRLPPASRVPCSIVLDEFHTFATDSLPSMLAETRKFGFRVTLANQSISQIDGRGFNPNVLGPILGNVANLVTFRVGMEDAGTVAGWFAPTISKEALTRLPNFEAVARLIHNGEPAPPVHLRTLPPQG